ncbi:uncharacterized protein LOC142656665 [Rhinoderma darwinii]|uniref:uncharacterized protein LOC142656665 n=1 Tax=Rhinoderma darwinii TaxID=43563 RepID=UPI003F66B2B4
MTTPSPPVLIYESISGDNHLHFSAGSCKTRNLDGGFGKMSIIPLLFAGLLVTLSAAVNTTSILAALPDNLLVNLSSCYNNDTLLSLDPSYFSLLFSKLNNNKTNAGLSQLSSNLDVLPLLTPLQIATFSLDLGSTNNTAVITDVLGTIQNANDVYDFLGYINAAAMLRNMSALRPPLAQALLNKTFEAIKSNVSMFTMQQWSQLFQDKLTVVLPEITPEQLSLVPQNISCDSYQAIIKSLDSTFNKMVPVKQENVYKSFIKPFQKKSGRACSQGSNSSYFLTQNFGKFSQFADYSDLVAFNGNFSALDVLSVLTILQKANFSLELNASSDPTAAASIVGTLQNISEVYDFLTYLNTGIVSKNMTLVSPALSQALLNKTFEAVKGNISTFNSSDWTQLFQNKLNFLLPEISPEQLSLIPLNMSCDSYQAILKSLDFSFPKMSSIKQEEIYKSLIKPYLTKKGPACAQNTNVSALIKLNFGKFSQFADYKDLVALNGNFSAADILPSLTMQQIVHFSLDPTINPAVAALIVGMIQNATDGKSFLNSLNTAAVSNNISSLSPYLSQALLTRTFQILKPNLNSYNSSDWTQLFQDRLRVVLPEISKDQLSLIPNNISCSSYQPIISSLDSSFPKMNSKNQGDIYKLFIKPYLKKKGNEVTCYNQTDANASAWLVNNLGSFMTFTSEEDLILFANDSMLQTFASDPSCIQLASQLKFPKDTAIYFTSLFTSSQTFNLTSIPDTFLCYLNPAALKNLNAAATLDITKKINKKCFNTPPGQTASIPTPEDVQVSISLVSKLNNFSSDTLENLGQTAVGLSLGQINKISDSDLQSSVSSLGNVTGWNVGQTRSIMNKLLNSNFQIQNLGSLGSLVTGLPSKKLQELDPALILNAVKDAQFASKLSSAPPTLQNSFVKQIVAANSTSSNVVKNVPASLASFIPKSSLLFKSEKPSLQDVNGKSWSPDQASMFFDDIANTATDYALVSSSVLQGFTCATPSKISNSQVKMLGKAMKTQNASLSEDQLNCLSRQITKNGYPTDLNLYPNEVFLFLKSANYSSIGNCTEFFTNVGKANISTLSIGSKLRSNLLANSLSCMNISGSSLTDNNIQVLGQLSCDLSPSYITNSSASILTQLSQCQSFTAEQQSAIQTLLGKENSVFGAPPTWTKDTLKSLGGISGFLTKDILKNISSVSLKSWMKEAVQTSALTRSQFVAIVYNLTPTRSKRAASCAAGKQITADNVNDNLLQLSYTAEELDACLDYDTLINYLSVLSSKQFTNEQLTVLKNKLDVLYPGGYPETILTSLGAISLICGDADVNKWNITSVDTLSSLLTIGPPDSLAKSIIGKYISSGNPLTDSAINVIGSKYICLLNSAQLDLITSSAISDAKALDVSACSQTVKDSLYVKAKASYQGEINQLSAYFNLIKPYLGGAPVANLKSLAANSPNMDIGTFVKLNPSAVLSLTVSDVKGLLGNNTADLKTQESNSVISNWIKIQKQADLDTLGLDIQGGIRDYSTSSPLGSSASTLTHSLSILLAVFGIFYLM